MNSSKVYTQDPISYPEWCLFETTWRTLNKPHHVVILHQSSHSKKRRRSVMTNGFISPLRAIHRQMLLPSLNLLLQHRKIFLLVFFLFREKRSNDSDSCRVRNEDAMARLEDIRMKKLRKEVNFKRRLRHFDCVPHMETLENFITA